MVLRACVWGSCCLVLLLMCLPSQADSGDNLRSYYYRPRPYYGYGYHGHPTSCEALERRFVSTGCAALAERLEKNSCQSSCGSTDGQECKPVSDDSCTEASGLCSRGRKCCQSTEEQEQGATCAMENQATCRSEQACSALQFSNVRGDLTGCEAGDVCCATPCPTERDPPPETPEAPSYAICRPAADGCDGASLFTRPDTGYFCPGDNQVCCLVSLWNQLPLTARHSETPSLFKTALKIYLSRKSYNIV